MRRALWQIPAEAARKSRRPVEASRSAAVYDRHGRRAEPTRRAASTDLQAGEFVVTAEYKINLLRGARGEKLRCRAEVLKPGRRLAVVEAQVWSEGEGRSELVAKLNATMAVVTPR